MAGSATLQGKVTALISNRHNRQGRSQHRCASCVSWLAGRLLRILRLVLFHHDLPCWEVRVFFKTLPSCCLALISNMQTRCMSLCLHTFLQRGLLLVVHKQQLSASKATR